MYYTVPVNKCLFDNLNDKIYTATPMARLEVEKVKNPGSGFNYVFTSVGLQAHADFDPTTGEAVVTFEEATNISAALEAVVNKIQSEARLWETNPVLLLHIDIQAGKFEKQLAEVADRFSLKGPVPADESGFGGVVFRAELPLAG
jgi:hypothetical protein